MSGLENRLNRPETKELIARVQKAAVTVASNDGGILPLEMSLKGSVVLNIGKSSAGDVFSKRLKRYMSVDCIQANPDSIAKIRKRLSAYNRVIVAVHTEKYAAYQGLLNEIAFRHLFPFLYI